MAGDCKSMTFIGIPTKQKLLNSANCNTTCLYFSDIQKLSLQLWDTAGMEQFRQAMPQHYYRNAKAVLFVYDMTDKNSFDNINKWIEECRNYQENDRVHWILIGNKSDCVDNIVISTEMAKNYANKQKMDLYETSAKNEIESNTINTLMLDLAKKLDTSEHIVVKNVPRPIIIKRRTQAHTSLIRDQIISDSFCSNC
ncbi:ras-related protein Rab-33B-like [Centruroides sculpturatus]|uniref:ras-related protein Rab-33B-like n=1 Tax=Centruroides sculpturatus TaxID=218467 RepID=UPI000C6EAAA2|nr:ras-related protein Rab-33B-like [Centruroides sculpturatus]